MAAPAVSPKKAPFLTTYLALAVLVGFIGYAYYDSKKPLETDKPKDKVLALDKDKVKEVTLAPATGDAIHLVKADTGWRMAAPDVVAADNTEVESLISTLQNLEVDQVILPSATKLEDFGLAPPQLKVSVVQAGSAQPLEILLGQKSPTGGGLYAKVPNSPRVFTVPSYVESSLEKKPFDLRDRDLLHIKRDAVKVLEVEGPSSFTLVRGPSGEFAFTAPLATRAGRWGVDSLLSGLEGVKMDSIAAEAPKDS